jgi:hypothetical protein
MATMKIALLRNNYQKKGTQIVALTHCKERSSIWLALTRIFSDLQRIFKV